jgi:FdhD protein
MTEAPYTVTRYHWLNGVWARESRPVAREEPLTIFVNGQELVTLVMTPEHLDDLVIGFLAAEGLIQHADDATIVHWVPEDGQVWVRVPGLPQERLNQFGRRYLGACCGKGRPGFYLANDEVTAFHVGDAGPVLSVETIFALSEELARYRAEAEPTGGLHSAALADASGILVWRTDIGRHNALDKVFGHLLRSGHTAAGLAIIFSGRISSEVLLKVAKMRCGLVISNAAPTSLAVSLAKLLGITAIGFVRPHELSVYTRPERVEMTLGKETAHES